MTIRRVWLQQIKDDRYVIDYRYQVGQFNVSLTDDPQEALTLITDRSDDEALLRLFQALTRHPHAGTDLLPFNDALTALELVRHFFRVVGRPATDEEIAGIPNATYVVDSAHYDLDAYGAEREICLDNNRIVDLAGDPALRTFHVLQVGRYVDADTGQLYPGMTVSAPFQNIFWALPDVLAEWPDDMNSLAVLPCDVIFDQDENGELNIQIGKPAAAE